MGPTVSFSWVNKDLVEGGERQVTGQSSSHSKCSGPSRVMSSAYLPRTAYHFRQKRDKEKPDPLTGLPSRGCDGTRDIFGSDSSGISNLR